MKREDGWGRAFLLAALIAAVCLVTGLSLGAEAQEATATASPVERIEDEGMPSLAWDSRLDSIGVTLTRAADCRAGCYRLVLAAYEDFTESGQRHHIYGSTSGGDPRWTVRWPDPGGSGGQHTYYNGQNHGMYGPGGCYAWPGVPSGPFHAFAGTNAATSDMVSGMGLRSCYHETFTLGWVYVAAAPATARPTLTPRPSATATPRPPAPTATPGGYPAPATPSPIPPGELGAPVPVVWFDGALWSCPKATRGNGTLLMQCVPVGVGR